MWGLPYRKAERCYLEVVWCCCSKVRKVVVVSPALRATGKNTVEALWLLGKGSTSENGGWRRVRRDPRGAGPFHPLGQESLCPLRHLQRFNSQLHLPAGRRFRSPAHALGTEPALPGLAEGKGLGSCFSGPTPAGLCLCRPCQRKAFSAS